MRYITFDKNRPYDLVLLGRVAVDFNPVDYFHPLEECTTFKKYVGGSPANIAVGAARHGMKIGFFARVSDDQLGDFVTQPGKLELLGDGRETLVTIHEGKFHQIKRMFAHQGKTVQTLKRLAIGPLQLDKGLREGQWRPLSEEEIHENLSCTHPNPFI